MSLSLRARRTAVLIAATAAAALAPAAALASTAAVELDPSGGATLIVQESAFGELNDVTVASSGGSYVVTDAAGILPGGSCSAVNATTVSCPVGSGASAVGGLGVSTASAADKIRIDATVTDLDWTVLDGGDGVDTITGGSQDDVIVGGEGDDILSGGGGDDVFISYNNVANADGRSPIPAPDGADTLDGGSGSGDMIAYGEILPYQSPEDPLAREVGVNVVLRGATPTTGNGEPSENDELVNVEDVLGGSGSDVLDGGDGANFLSGGESADTLIGGDGADELDGNEGWDLFDAGPGDDLVKMREDLLGYSGELNHSADCGTGTDRIAVGPSDANTSIVGCEEVSPRIVSSPAVDTSSGIATGVRLTVKNLVISGVPQPVATITWVSCTTEFEGCVTRATGASYVPAATDVGRYIGAVADATNGDVATLGFYATTSYTMVAVGPVQVTPVLPALRPPNVPPAQPIAQAPVLARAISASLLGGPVTYITGVGALSVYAPERATTAFRPRAGRTTKVLAMVCIELGCDVTVKRELRLRPRSGGATRRIKLPTRDMRLPRGQGSVVTLRLTRAQLAAVRRAGRADLRVTLRSRLPPGLSSAATWSFRIRVG